MIVPKYIKKLIKKREKVATEFVKLDSKLNDWLCKQHIFNEICLGDKYSLFNGGCQELESGSASITIEYLEKIENDKDTNRQKV